MATRIDVGVHVSKLLEQTPQNEVVTNMLASIRTGRSGADGIKRTLFNGMDAQIRNMVDYGEKQYYLGLPKGNLTYQIPDLEPLKRVLRAEGKEEVTLQFHTYDEPSEEIVAKWVLQEQYQWDSVSNEVVSLETGSHIFKYASAQLVYTGHSTGAYQVLKISLDKVSKADASVTSEEITYQSPYVDIETPAYQVIYTLPSEDNTKEYFFYYCPLQGDYSDLHVLEEATTGEYFPTVLMRTNGRSIDYRKPLNQEWGKFVLDRLKEDEFEIQVGTLVPSEWPEFTINPESTYKYIRDLRGEVPIVMYSIRPVEVIELTEVERQTGDMLRTIGIERDELLDSINSNPDIAQIDDVFVCFLLQPDTEIKSSQEAMFHYFHHLWQENVGSFVTPNRAPGGSGYITNAKQYKVTHGDFNIRMDYDYIHISQKTGTIPPKGTAHTLTNVSEPQISLGFNVDHLYDQDIQVDIQIDPNETEQEGTYIVIRKQVDDTSYLEMVVAAPMHTSYVYKDKLVVRTLRDAGDMGFYMPLHIPATYKVPAFHRDSIYKDTLCVLSHSITYTHLEWYETEDFIKGFTIIMMFAAVTMGAMNLATLAKSSTFIGSLKSALVTYLRTRVIIEIGEVALEELGIKDSFLLMVIALAVAYASQENFDIGELVDAETLLESVTLFAQTTDEYIQSEMDQLQQAMADLKEEMEDWEEEIEKAKDMLSNKIDILEVVRQVPYIDINESPADFIYRTVENSNPGVWALKAPEVYVNNALKLPEFNSYLGTQN